MRKKRSVLHAIGELELGFPGIGTALFDERRCRCAWLGWSEALGIDGLAVARSVCRSVQYLDPNLQIEGRGIAARNGIVNRGFVVARSWAKEGTKPPFATVSG